MRTAIVAFVTAAVVFAGVYIGARWLDRQTGTVNQSTRGDYRQRELMDSGKTVEIDGALYRQRKDMTTILLMGVDQVTAGVNGSNGTDGQEEAASLNRSGGQADFLRVVTIDHSAQTVAQLQIDRDTMTPITILGILGNRSGTRTTQICLSHGFGDGGAESCELTEEAVSNLLYGMNLNFYVAMNLDGISVLNDAVGGIEVTLEDDFSEMDPAMQKGATLTLQGKQAEYYVRGRTLVGEGTNEERMARQQVYLENLSAQLGEKIRESRDSVGALYDDLESYLVTDMARGRLINEIWNARSYQQLGLMKPEGKYQIGEDGYMEFHVDDVSLKKMVIDMFFEPAN